MTLDLIGIEGTEDTEENPVLNPPNALLSGLLLLGYLVGLDAAVDLRLGTEAYLGIVGLEFEWESLNHEISVRYKTNLILGPGLFDTGELWIWVADGLGGVGIVVGSDFSDPISLSVCSILASLSVRSITKESF